jgi:hypothetical protein
MGIVSFTLNGIDYEVISFEIVPHPDPVLRRMGRIRCIVLVEEKGDSPAQPLKFTCHRYRHGLRDWEIQNYVVSMVETALAQDKEEVLRQQSKPDGVCFEIQS